MAQVTMPKMGDAMEEGTLVRWLKQVGDPVEEGDNIAEIETEKAAIEIAAFESGVLSRILVKEGETVAVGTPIAELAAEAGAGNGEGHPESGTLACNRASAGHPHAQGTEPDRAASKPDAGGRAPASSVTESESPAKRPPAGSTSRPRSPAAETESRPEEPAAGRPEPASPSSTVVRPTDADTEPSAPPPDRAAAGERGGPAQKRDGEAAVPGAAPPRRPAPAIPTSDRPLNAPPSANETRLRASPLARRVAAESGVDLGALHGTGPSGRILEADVRDFVETGSGAGLRRAPVPPETPPAPAEERPLSPMRRTIARRLAESKQAIPHFYVTSEVDMGEAEALRRQLSEAANEERPRLSPNDFVLKAVAAALRAFPAMNVSFAGDRLRLPSRVNLGMAVALEDGLVVPVLFDADRKSLTALAREARALAARAREGRLRPEEMAGATFTISNLGMFDVEEFSAIINPPESGILAVASVQDRVVAWHGEVAIRPRLRLTLSADHRAIDGVTAAKFLQEVKRRLEAPLRLLE